MQVFAAAVLWRVIFTLHFACCGDRKNVRAYNETLLALVPRSSICDIEQTRASLGAHPDCGIR
jgi:hypothetical protein